MPNGAVTPRWREDSSEFFVHGFDNYVYSVAIRTLEDGSPDVSRPTRLFDSLVTGSTSGAYDAHPSGEKFLIAEPIDKAGVQTITYMTDWRGSLR